MTKHEHPPAEYRLTPEDEKKFETLGAAVADVIASADTLLVPGDRFALHPDNFAEASDFEEDAGQLPSVLCAFAFRELGVTPAGLTTVREEGNEKWFATDRPDVLLGTDGTDWWIELKK